MIKLISRDLSTKAQRVLAKYQSKIDTKTNYAEQVAEAKHLWKPQNKTFEEITENLVAMCPGTRRCCYCEDARGDDIEHFHPKNLYPNFTFEWENYLLACSACNSNVKRSSFAIIDNQGMLRDVTRNKNAEIVPPIVGAAALINPRFEDPLAFLRIDLLNTFHFSRRRELSNYDALRADYTIQALQLNTRAELVTWRRDAFAIFVSWVDKYQRHKAENGQQELDADVITLKRLTHLAVWEEMIRVYRERDLTRWNDLKRKHETIRELDRVFSRTPEVLEIRL